MEKRIPPEYEEGAYRCPAGYALGEDGFCYLIEEETNELGATEPRADEPQAP